ncbi:hypothetical protein OA980_01095 [Prochlorococcus sp. AH-716-A06]|jgi:hypothetical protein|nr:hypothetical protein [Prochlorococcus sp. AH-716-A06]|tara:strand:+ start:5705 stop:6085 length:381 start_codon:yes stop_codon:yes gene_type:complete
MKRFLLGTILLGLIPSANAGIYIYPNFKKGIEVRCLDNEPKHLISFKSGRAMKFEDYGDDKFKFPEVYLFPEKTNKQYSYFPSTAGTKCSYRKLSRKEREHYRKMALDTCRKSDLNKRREFCYGWN